MFSFCVKIKNLNLNHRTTVGKPAVKPFITITKYGCSDRDYYGNVRDGTNAIVFRSENVFTVCVITFRCGRRL